VKRSGFAEEKINARGEMTVWQRISYLVDPVTWCPLHTLYNFAHKNCNIAVGGGGILSGMSPKGYFHEILARLVDDSEHMEFRPGYYGPEIYTGLVKLGGFLVGCIGNRQGWLGEGYPEYADYPGLGGKRYRISGFKPYQVTRIGLARTFQMTSIYSKSSVLDNVVVGQSLHAKVGLWGSIFGIPSARREATKVSERALEILSFVGLEGKEKQLAGSLTETRA
jgi:hypothetical protein